MLRLIATILIVSVIFEIPLALALDNKARKPLFRINKTIVAEGDDVRLDWTFPNVEHCSLLMGRAEDNMEEFGPFPPNHQWFVTIESAMVFRLVCEDKNGKSLQSKILRVRLPSDRTWQEWGQDLVRETFDLGHLFNHFVFDHFFNPALAGLLGYVGFKMFQHAHHHHGAGGGHQAAAQNAAVASLGAAMQQAINDAVRAHAHEHAHAE